jgi:hypothetical protein
MAVKFERFRVIFIISSDRKTNFFAIALPNLAMPSCPWARRRTLVRTASANQTTLEIAASSVDPDITDNRKRLVKFSMISRKKIRYLIK